MHSKACLGLSLLPLPLSFSPPAVVRHELWRQHCLRAHPAVAAAAATIDTSRVPRRPKQSTAGAADAAGGGGDTATAAVLEGSEGKQEAPTASAAEVEAAAALAPAAPPAEDAGTAGSSLDAIDTAGTAEAAELRSAFFKRLQYRLTAPLAHESLIAQALAASSTDHPQVRRWGRKGGGGFALDGRRVHGWHTNCP